MLWSRPKRSRIRMCYGRRMTTGMDMAAIAALVGDPARANMLAAMMDGRAHTATELAQLAGIAAPTASGHLAKLHRGKLIGVAAQGRHRYYRLASADIARMLEGIMVVAAEPPTAARRATPRIDPALRQARTCYDHLAGELGVALADALIGCRIIDLTAEGATVTRAGRAMLAAADIPLEGIRRSRRIYCRPCLDWSERRPHLAGVLGAALLDRALAVGLVQRQEGTRALTILNRSCKDLLHILGITEGVGPLGT